MDLNPNKASTESPTEKLQRYLSAAMYPSSNWDDFAEMKALLAALELERAPTQDAVQVVGDLWAILTNTYHQASENEFLKEEVSAAGFEGYASEFFKRSSTGAAYLQSTKQPFCVCTLNALVLIKLRNKLLSETCFEVRS